jgi:hypothetical protein
MKKWTWVLLLAMCLSLCATAWAEDSMAADVDKLVAAWMQNREANGFPPEADEPFLPLEADELSQVEILRIAAKNLLLIWPGELSGLMRYTPGTMLMEPPDEPRQWHVSFFTDAPLRADTAHPVDTIQLWLDAKTGAIREYIAETAVELPPLAPGEVEHG